MQIGVMIGADGAANTIDGVVNFAQRVEAKGYITFGWPTFLVLTLFRRYRLLVEKHSELDWGLRLRQRIRATRRRSRNRQ